MIRGRIIKVRIGIDIDDTTLVTFQSMIKYVDKYDVEDLGCEGIKGEFGFVTNRYYLNILYGWYEIYQIISEMK